MSEKDSIAKPHRYGSHQREKNPPELRLSKPSALRQARETKERFVEDVTSKSRPESQAEESCGKSGPGRVVSVIVVRLGVLKIFISFEVFTQDSTCAPRVHFRNKGLDDSS